MGLWASLTHRNPSAALTTGAFLLPFFTFYSITGFLLGTISALAGGDATYGFTVVAISSRGER